MNKLFLFICLGAIMMYTSSCRIHNPRYFNSPSAHAPAFLEKKGDKMISANIAIMPKDEYRESDLSDSPDKTRESYTTGFDVRTAYAFSDQFMATLGGLYRKEKDAFKDNDVLQTASTSEINYTRKALDIGIGVLFPFSERKRVIFNPIVGVNFGRSESVFTNTSHTINDNRVFHFNGNYHKFYLKPYFNFNFHRNFKMSAVPQFSFLKYSNIYDNYPQDAQELFGLNSLQKRYLFLYEPATFFQLGFDKVDWLKLDLGFVFSFYRYGENNPYKLRTRNFQLSAGFSIYP
ncbi:hypothetical protein [Proteiniphilum acetatigenes]|uniref:hypothetical protein n=1 Tax=Proteiniphilum acetatigenes TaxID=294710 RepID=UPI00039B2210|nr:hypothetical protein [Proteiniphilum acetatigenes]